MQTVRTTVAIEECVLREAKKLAERSHRSLGAVVNDALIMALAHDRKQPPKQQGRVTLPVSGGGGLRPGVDLEDKDALYELLDMPDLDPDDLPDQMPAPSQDGRRAAG